MSQRCFAQPRRPVQQQVIQRPERDFAASMAIRSFLQLLPDVLVQPGRTQGVAQTRVGPGSSPWGSGRSVGCFVAETQRSVAIR